MPRTKKDKNILEGFDKIFDFKKSDIDKYFDDINESDNEPDNESKNITDNKNGINNIKGLNIKKIHSASTVFKQRKSMADGYIPDFPSSVVLVGKTASGKSTLVMNMLLNPDMYKNYFDKIYVFSITAKTDDLYNNIKKNNKNVIFITSDLQGQLDSILGKRIDEVSTKKGAQNCKPVLFIFEDLTSHIKLMKSSSFMKCFVENRHYGVMVIACVHKYKSLERTCRLQANHIIFFPSNMSDQDALIEDVCPPNYTNKEFKKIMDYSFSSDSNNERPFIYINNKRGFKERFRKCFSIILDLNK